MQTVDLESFFQNLPTFPEVHTCPKCGEIFTPRNERQINCRKDCGRKIFHKTSESAHRSRTAKRARRKTGGTLFIPLDGESIYLPDGRFLYSLLSVGQQSITSPHGEELPLSRIFEFIYEVFTETRQENPNRNIAVIGFFLGFDFTHWLKQLPEERAAMLLTEQGKAKRARKSPEAAHLGPFPVDVTLDDGVKWEFDMLASKRLKIRPASLDGEDSHPWCHICDAGPFFQTSLVKAANPKGWPAGIVDPEDYRLICEGKSRRAIASRVDRAMIEYNLAENRVLASMMQAYEHGMNGLSEPIYIKPPQWYGPGSAAAAWLKAIEAPQRVAYEEILPEDLHAYARAAYYGGRFEVFRHGIVAGDCHEYDINSAYPHAQSQCPDWTAGEWKYHTRFWGIGSIRTAIEKGQHVLSEVEFESSSDFIGPFPFRTEKGGILYPQKGVGTYWGHELLAAEDAGLLKKFKILSCWVFTPSTVPARFPFAGLRKLYQTRLDVGKNSPEGKALKLIYNSTYGKTAQSVGEPKYASPLVAGFITSKCRAQILDAIGSHPAGYDSVVMVATDGVYFTGSHPGLTTGTGLGDWEYGSVKTRLTTFLPGLYWDDASREALKISETKVKSRGIDAESFAKKLGELDEAYSVFDGTEWPVITIPIRFTYRSLKQSLITTQGVSNWHKAGVPIEGATKQICSHPKHKRDVRSLSRDGRSWFSKAHKGSDLYKSTPYDKMFGLELTARQELDEPSVDIDSLYKEVAELLSSHE